MKFFRLALVALALVASFAVVGCKSEEAAPAGDAAAPAAGAEAPAEAPK